MADEEATTVEAAPPPKGKEAELRADGHFPKDYDPTKDPGPVRWEDTPEFEKEAYPDLVRAPAESIEN